MTFKDEESRTKFHELPTQLQYDFLAVEEICTKNGLDLYVEVQLSGSLEVRIWIDQKLKHGTVA